VAVSPHVPHQSTHQFQEFPLHPTEPDNLPTFVLPFDGNRPILVTGYAHTGKSTFIRHLVMTEAPAQGVFIIDPTGGQWNAGAKRVTVLRPEDTSTDVEFYQRAADMVRGVEAMPGAMLVIEEFGFLAAPYKHGPIAEHSDFVASVLDAVRSVTGRNRIIIGSQTIPNAEIMSHFGARFRLGPATNIDWGLLCGHEPEMPVPTAPGAGLMALDGGFYAFSFPDTATPTVTEAKKVRFSRRK
jgi:hypothetical protein